MRFYDLAFIKQSDGSIRLTQSDHGEDYIIDAHPEQILFIARKLCGLKHETAQQVSDLERRIAVLTDGLQKLVCADWFRNDVIDRCSDGVEILCRLDALLDLAFEFDGGRLQPSEPPADEHIAPQAATTAIGAPKVSTQPAASAETPLTGQLFDCATIQTKGAQHG